MSSTLRFFGPQAMTPSLASGMMITNRRPKLSKVNRNIKWNGFLTNEESAWVGDIDMSILSNGWATSALRGTPLSIWKIRRRLRHGFPCNNEKEEEGNVAVRAWETSGKPSRV